MRGSRVANGMQGVGIVLVVTPFVTAFLLHDYRSSILAYSLIGMLSVGAMLIFFGHLLAHQSKEMAVYALRQMAIRAIGMAFSWKLVASVPGLGIGWCIGLMLLLASVFDAVLPRAFAWLGRS
ncbi:hypothetical protein EON81_27535 [bacterium]|nr:MAG: hypothetical protein EON81_27535 [bacterium]